IRDRLVPGVQTCAFPILFATPPSPPLALPPLPAFAVFSLPDSSDCESLLHGPQGSFWASEPLVIATAVDPSPPFAEAEPPFALALPLVTDPPVADEPSDGPPHGSQ